MRPEIVHWVRRARGPSVEEKLCLEVTRDIYSCVDGVRGSNEVWVNFLRHRRTAYRDLE